MLKIPPVLESRQRTRGFDIVTQLGLSLGRWVLKAMARGHGKRKCFIRPEPLAINNSEPQSRGECDHDQAGNNQPFMPSILNCGD